MKLYNILLVEDDEVDIITVERAFVKANIANPLFKARNGLEAIDLLHSNKIKSPRIVLLDLNMPKMNGLEFLEVIRSDKELKRLPVIVLTSSSDERDVWRAYDKYVSGYMTKPISMDQFVEKMATLGHYWSLCEISNGI